MRVKVSIVHTRENSWQQTAHPCHHLYPCMSSDKLSLKTCTLLVRYSSSKLLMSSRGEISVKKLEADYQWSLAVKRLRMGKLSWDAHPSPPQFFKTIMIPINKGQRLLVERDGKTIKLVPSKKRKPRWRIKIVKVKSEMPAKINISVNPASEDMDAKRVSPVMPKKRISQKSLTIPTHSWAL